MVAPGFGFNQVAADLPQLSFQLIGPIRCTCSVGTKMLITPFAE